MKRAILLGASVLSLLFVTLSADTSVARKNRDNGGFQNPRDLISDLREQIVNGNGNQNQSGQEDGQFINAVNNRRDAYFIQGKGVVVSRILPDDNSGLRHQRWYVRLSNGKEMFAVYNMDITRRVPVQVGQKMNMGGEFKWTHQGPLLHWLHEDPRNKRPHGYVDVNGQRYGEVH
ncbi:MAG: hypothetical protein BroJett040_26010 [Oligoflexia bacterium]|nr:MAG: hypothetical protein BroJett040_26010 [Oligoflexia bacterium]